MEYEVELHEVGGGFSRTTNKMEPDESPEDIYKMVREDVQSWNEHCPPEKRINTSVIRIMQPVLAQVGFEAEFYLEKT
jgi:hypothetical protein